MTPDDLATAMVPVAADLACLVRDGDLGAIAARLDSLIEWDEDGFPLMQRLYALVVVLAAMVPDDAGTVDLLGWLEPGSPQRAEMLTKVHTKAAQRQQRGLPLWGPMEALEKEYQQGRWRLRKAAAEASRAA